MQYPDGQEAHIGDRVELWAGNLGTVVCSIDAAEYQEDYPKEQWSYLGRGILVVSEQTGLIHYEAPECTMRLLARAPAP
jgi:hypothetical protein